MNNKRYKFRAYHTGVGRMLVNTSQNFEGEVFKWLAEGQPIIIMEYTGHKDVNGVEIYEGDIFRWTKMDNTMGNNRVIFDDYRASFCYVAWNLTISQFSETTTYGCNDGGGVVNTRRINFKELEVIGNIYENPDLIRK